MFNSCKKDACEDCITHSPVVNAGNNTIVVLPDHIVNLNGSLSFDPDNNITDYLWTKISGPSSFNITNANAGDRCGRIVSIAYLPAGLRVIRK